METRELTCIRCPMGCQIRVELEGGEVKSITGNTCPRGADYAAQEVTNPTRTLTSSVRVRGGDQAAASVKTRTEIPKERMMDIIRAIKEIELTAPVHIGDIVCPDVAGTGVDMIATSNVLTVGDGS
ncbi:MAG: DUF1667 domain-containing protein [Lachnospiraceae bacterium]|nr:DUF1667 domain-containing protein [Lachnospiraceae bacterium]